MIHVGDITSNVGGVQYRGGYHLLLFESRGGISSVGRGGVQYRGGTQITKDDSPRYSRYRKKLLISLIS